MYQASVYFAGRRYSDNKDLIKQINQKMNLRWDFHNKSGWFNGSTYIKAIFEGTGLPATFNIQMPTKDDLDEVVNHMINYGGEEIKSVRETNENKVKNLIIDEMKLKINNFKDETIGKYSSSFISGWIKQIENEYNQKVISKGA